jgi:hypothetical protein
VVEYELKFDRECIEPQTDISAALSCDLDSEVSGLATRGIVYLAIESDKRIVGAE